MLFEAKVCELKSKCQPNRPKHTVVFEINNKHDIRTTIITNCAHEYTFTAMLFGFREMRLLLLASLVVEIGREKFKMALLDGINP